MILEKIPSLKSEKGASAASNAAAVIAGLCLIVVILLTSAQAVCFWIPDWWRNEYAKYDTPSKVNGVMSLDDAVHVTEDMLDYCIGRLDTLDETEASIDGVKVPFFTNREKMHLADCRRLFQAAVKLRVMAVLFAAVLIIYISVHNSRDKAFRILARGYLISLAAVLTAAAVTALLAMHDFTRAFTVFHHIFFDNDLWILYPDKDNLINIMQEDVFADAAIWIGGIWAVVCLFLAALSCAMSPFPKHSVRK